MKIVMKFGGTSVGDGKKIRHVAELAKSYYDKGDQVVLVTSALAGVTDRLLDVGNDACENGKVTAVTEFITALKQQHFTAVDEAIDDESVKAEVIEFLTTRIDELEKALVGICYLGELTLRSRDNISSYGERLAAPIVSGALRSSGIASVDYTGGEAGIITTDVFGGAKPLQKSYALIQERLTPGLKNSVQVVTGFIGENEDGNITTLGRSGSDYTASIVGVGIKADEIWLWKEVDGIMTANPKIVPSARTIHFISYQEAMELSSLGAEVLHPRAIEPSMMHNIPVRVKSTFKPDFDGTLVVTENKKSKNVVKAVSMIKKVSLINVSSPEMVDSVGKLAVIFSILANKDVGVRLISQGSESSISFIVNDADRSKTVKALKAELGEAYTIDYRSDVSVVAVVGAGMAGTPGVAKRVFTALGKENISIIMISQGSSEYNISCVVSSAEVNTAVAALHAEFELDKPENGKE
ncbi:Bifunctional aspartokinase/homoserine dehydrogenase 1 [Methanimicrococcus sp. At1]|uniref:Aspartokinase n=1 Tax=Methanimicrococcus hacksteinii TaxID=3028293 RepID=A0ABU3VPA4_9EURY|nr:aspartate kinase [Methanimicrococcus sp. At1]MDV0445249.1 Bifunctional aspartokinase/homoserine dehydrogenase 1 [Methanimicrococcus sp. At1]